MKILILYLVCLQSFKHETVFASILGCILFPFGWWIPSSIVRGFWRICFGLGRWRILWPSWKEKRHNNIREILSSKVYFCYTALCLKRTIIWNLNFSCPACEAFHEDWQRVAETLNGTAVVVDFNCEEGYDTCYYVGISGYPEFAVFYNSKLIAKYDDEYYSYNSMVNFILEKEFLEDEYKVKAKRPWDQ